MCQKQFSPNVIRFIFVKALKFTAGRWFFPGTPISSTNKTERHGKIEILLKVALNTITLTLTILTVVDYTTTLW
jgi:hypothetical protein